MALRTLLRQRVEVEVEEQVVLHPVEQAVRKYEQSRDALRKFMADNHEVFDQFDNYVGEYNSSVDEASSIMRDTKDLKGVYTGEFKRGKPGETVTYNIDKLPDNILDIPGVLTVDSKVVKELIAEKIIDASAVAQAVISKTKSGNLTGPKPVELQVGKR